MGKLKLRYCRNLDKQIDLGGKWKLECSRNLDKLGESESWDVAETLLNRSIWGKVKVGM